MAEPMVPAGNAAGNGMDGPTLTVPAATAVAGAATGRSNGEGPPPLSFRSRRILGSIAFGTLCPPGEEFEPEERLEPLLAPRWWLW